MLIETTKYLVPIGFWFGYQNWNCRMLLCFVKFCFQMLTLKTASLKHVSDKVRRAKWPLETSGNIMFRENLHFSIGFATNAPIFTPPPLLRFLCLINSFDKRNVSCIYITCPTYPIPIDIRYIQYALNDVQWH